MAVEVVPRVRRRQRGSPANVPRLKYELAARLWTPADAALKSGVSKWVIDQALAGHAIDTRSFRKLAKALASTPPTDLGLISKPEET